MLAESVYVQSIRVLLKILYKYSKIVNGLLLSKMEDIQPSRVFQSSLREI